MFLSLFNWKNVNGHHRSPYVEAAGIVDPESISAMGSRKFAVTDENPASVWTLTLPAQTDSGAALVNPTGATKVFSDLSTKGFTKAKENLGFEGVTWHKATDTFYAVQEMSPTAIFKISGDGSTVTTVNSNLATSGMLMAGALTRSADATDELFVIIKEPKAIHRINIATGLSTVRGR